MTTAKTMEDLAKQFAAHPRFRLAEGMRTFSDRDRIGARIMRVFNDGAPDGSWPDLRDDATAGVLLGELAREVGVVDVSAKLSGANGAPAPCMFGCPRKRASGRKHEQCFPSNESELWDHWRHVVTCRLRAERVDVAQ